MHLFQFLDLKLSPGEMINIIDERGGGTNGIYLGEYNNSLDSFLFENFSTGKTETIHIEKLQDLWRTRLN